MSRPAGRRRSGTTPADDRPAGAAGAASQISLLPPEGAAMLHLIRENLRLLRELATRYEIGWLPPELLTSNAPVVRSPRDVAEYLRAELAGLVQEQLRVVLLNTKNRILGVALIYQGGVNAATVASLADCFREAVRVGASSVVFVHNHPSGDPTPSP
jgi:DNA repair protein RadC